jgi:hypothetical protein
MARQIINLGTADKGNGDPIRTAFEKTNSNFAELYAILAGGGGARVIATDIIGSVFGDDSTKIVDGVSGTLHGRLIGDVEGSVFADDSTLLVDAVSGKIRGNVQTATAWSVTAGAYTSTFNTDGSLTLPPTGALSTGSINFSGTLRVGSRSQYQFEEIVDEGGPSPVYYSKLSLPEIAEIFAGENLSLSTWGSEFAVKVRNPGDFSDHTWAFGNDGNLTLPGDIKSEGNINVEINLSDSTLRRWQFGEDGHLTLPVGGDIKNSNGVSVLSAGGVNFVSPPTWKYGQAGDTAGMISADSNYFYICFRNFIDNSNACWHRIAKDGSW